MHHHRQRADEGRWRAVPRSRIDPDHYFGAVVLGGTGVPLLRRYCVVLKRTPPSFRTTPWCLTEIPTTSCSEPLAGREDTSHCRAAPWTLDQRPDGHGEDEGVAADCGAPRSYHRWCHVGTGAHDESFIEVHKRGTFGPDDVHGSANQQRTLRSKPISSVVGTGHPLSVEESIWLSRRHEGGSSTG